MRYLFICLQFILFSTVIYASGDKNYQVYAEKCSSCHGLEVIEKKQKTKDQWKETIKRMERYGAKFDGKQDQILEYLINKK